MNKKYLSAVLFGALLASTTGTFTSCKDYDDDINGLNERVDAVEKTLADLNAKFGSLAYVKSVSFADGKLVVTDQAGNPTTYTIPNTDTNTTYTLESTSKREGNVTTVTVTLKGSDGTTSTQTFTITDNDTVTEDTNTQLDPTLFWMDSDNTMWYGPKDDKEKSIKTGVTVPKQPVHDKTTVDVVNYKDEAGNILGWEIKVDGQPLSTKLLIQDVLPITGFEYIPEAVLADWGERVIVFEENSYVQKDIVGDKLVDASPAKTLFMSNLAIPQFQVNPASATIAQLTNKGKAAILRKDITQVTRTPGTFIEWKETKIDKGVMTVSLEADPTLFATEKDKLNTIALQFETTAKNTITTEYIGVVNQTAKVDLRLTDASVTAEKPGNYDQHYSSVKSLTEKQKAVIDGANMPAKDNAYLVQNVTYSKAIEGVNLADYVSVCNIKTGQHVFFDYTKYADLKLTFEAVSYEVKDTPQEKYMSLTEKDGVYTFKGVNYGNVNQSCIGKAPMVLAKLIDTHNGNAIVSAAYIKLLIVGDAAAEPEDDITITENATIGIGCNKPAYEWSTTDEFMSTKVYTFSTNANLTALSKEQFHLLYSYTDEAVEGFTNKGDWTVTEILNSDDSKANHGAKFVLTTEPLAAGTYEAYAMYKKTDDANTILTVTNGAIYPEYVAIKHVVTVDPVDFKATAKERVANAWNNDKTMASIYCQTPGTGNTTRIVGDLNELFVGGKVQFDCEFDKEKYPDFVDDMTYRFEFSTDNLKAVGLDGTEYQLTVNAAHTKLYAVGKDLTGAALEAARVDANLVASLSGANNKDVEYADTDVAKNLLNKEPRGPESFKAVMQIVYVNGCELPVEVLEGKFDLAFIRPVNVASNSDKFFTDGLNVGDVSNILNLGELVNFTDWRKEAPLNSFAKNLSYYQYYGVTRINCEDIKKVKTNWAGKRQTLEEAFGADLAAKIIKIDSKTATPDGTKLPDYGTVTYIKTSGAEIKAYELYIPLTITYTWGTIKETITVQVKATK